MSPSSRQLGDFDEFARRPATWLGSSKGHLAVYEVLTDHVERLRMQVNKPRLEFSGCWTAAYLHAGLAIENAVKASQIRSNPDMVRDGRVNRKGLGRRSGHEIVGPCALLLGSLSDSERRVLRKLEEFVVWAGKYNVPMRAEVFYDEDSMNTLRNTPMNERELIRSLVSRLHQLAVAK